MGNLKMSALLVGVIFTLLGISGCNPSIGEGSSNGSESKNSGTSTGNLPNPIHKILNIFIADSNLSITGKQAYSTQVLLTDGSVYEKEFYALAYYKQVDLNNILSIPTGFIPSTNVYDTNTCALTSDSKVFCWGTNELGQVGNGTYDSLFKSEIDLLDSGQIIGSTGYVFETFNALSDVNYLFGLGESPDTFCAINKNNDLYCWGEAPFNSAFGANITKSNLPTKLHSNAEAFSIRGYFGDIYFGDTSNNIRDIDGTLISSGCYYLNNRKFNCPGAGFIEENIIDATYNYNRFSDYYFIDINNNLSKIDSNGNKTNYSNEKYSVLYTARAETFCGIRLDGTVDCWGKNSKNGKIFGSEFENIASSDSPITISGIQSAVSFPMTYSGSTLVDEQICVLNSLNEIQCWGDNLDGIVTLTP